MTTTEINNRADLVRSMRSLLDRAQAAARDLNATETAEYAKLEREVDAIDRNARLSDRENRLRAQRDGNYKADLGGPGVTTVHSDAGRYSIARALRRASEGKPLEGVEREVHDEIARDMPSAPRGILIPFNLTTGTGGGDYLIATEKGGIIDILRSKLVLKGLGAPVLTGLVGDLDLPRVDTATNASWRTEVAALGQSSPEFGQIALRPKRAGTYTEVSRQLLVQNSPDVEAWLKRDLGSAIAGLWESAAINGDGTSGAPLGILSTSGIGSVAGGTDGLAPTWAHVVGLESAVAIDNADVGALGYLTNSKVRGKLKTTLRNPSGTDATYVFPDDGRLNGYTTAITNHVPSNLVKGSSGAVCSAVVFGNFSDLVLAQWGPGIDVLVNPYIKDTEGIVRLTAHAFVDVGVRRAESFAAMLDALTT